MAGYGWLRDAGNEQAGEDVDLSALVNGKLATSIDADGCVPLGSRDPKTGRVVLSPKKTLPTADAYVRQFHSHAHGRTLHCYGGVLYRWRDNRFEEIEDIAVKQSLQQWLHNALRYYYCGKSKTMQLTGFDSNPTTVKAALESIKSHVQLPANTPIPTWLGSGDQRPHVNGIIACKSKSLYLPTMQSLEPTPQFFNTSALEFDPDPDRPVPPAWSEFLHQLFDDDLEAINLLQEWFGYCLTSDTAQQKLLLIVGPKRSGKGTIARVLIKLIGSTNVCGPTTSGLGGPFGLQPLLDKSLAIVSDARFHGPSIPSVVERLLCISGEDTLTIDRKNLPSVSVKLPIKVMFLTNEFPRFTDSSGALAGRFVILRLTRSFYGHEDTKLTERLTADLPGILNWAIEGWQRLQQRGHFVVPASSGEVVEEIEDLSSPVAAFVRRECIVQPEKRVWIDDLYNAWKEWCEREGRTVVSTRQAFGRDLAAAVPEISRRRATGNIPFYQGIDLRRSTP
jgi:putative DNA primase/helicase